MAAPDWYERFFHGVALDCWNKAIPAEQTAAEVDYLERMLEPAPGSRLLDVPCGAGRHARPLAARGHRITGIDVSDAVLDSARELARRDEVEIELIRHDMRELTLDRAFDGAYCFGNSFGYLDHAGTVEFLCGLGAALRPGARFVLDTGMAAESILPELEQNPWWQVDDILLAVENLYVPAESRLDTRYTFVQDGKTETREAHHWVFTVAEIGRMLTAAGLSVRSLHASTDGEPYQAGAERLLLTAKKPE